MNMKRLFYFLPILFCLACSEQNSKDAEMLRIKLDGISSSPQREKIVLEDLGTSVSTVELETKDSCLLNRITQLVDIDYLWIVADRQIYKFAKDGKFICQIGRKGQGPQEYIAPEHIQVDNDQQQVYVLDFFGRKMLVYDYNGKFVNSWSLPEDYSLNRIALHNKKFYYTSFSNTVSPDLLAYDVATSTIDTISFRDRTMGQEAFAGQTFIYDLNKKTYLYHYFNDTVYTFDEKLHPDFIFDLGDAKFTYPQLTIIGENATEEPIRNPKIQVTNFIDMERFLVVSYSVRQSWAPSQEQDNRFALYDKSEGEMHSDVAFVYDAEPLFDIKPENALFASSDEHSIYIFKQADELLESPQFEDLDVESNPVIIKYTFQ